MLMSSVKILGALDSEGARQWSRLIGLLHLHYELDWGRGMPGRRG